MKNFILLITIVLLANTIQAQRQYFDKDKIYPTVKIYQKGKSEVLKVSNLKLINDSLLQFQELKTGTYKVQQYLTSDVRYIAVKNGTYAGRYAAIGGGFGLLSAIYGVLSVKNDPTLDDSDVNWTPFVVGFTAGGAALGALIGATKSKWKILYIPDNKTSYILNISPYFANNYCGIGLKVNF